MMIILFETFQYAPNIDKNYENPDSITQKTTIRMKDKLRQDSKLDQLIERQRASAEWHLKIIDAENDIGFARFLVLRVEC